MAVTTETVGAWSETVSSRTLTAEPSPPRNVHLFPGATTITVSWDEPSHPGSAPIAFYEITHREPGEEWPDGLQAHTVYATDPRSVTIASLDPETVYEVRVRAYNNDDVWGAWSETLSVKTLHPEAPATAPGLLRLHITGSTSLNAAWQKVPGTGGRPRSVYDVRYRRAGLTPAAGWAVISTRTSTADITGLASGQEYEVQVRARNPDPGPWSRSVKQTPSDTAPYAHGHRPEPQFFGVEKPTPFGTSSDLHKAIRVNSQGWNHGERVTLSYDCAHTSFGIIADGKEYTPPRFRMRVR